VFGLILQKDSDFEPATSSHHSRLEEAKQMKKSKTISHTVPEEGEKIPQEIVEKLKEELLAPGEENAGSSKLLILFFFGYIFFKDHIVVVTHSSVLLSAQQYFDGKYQYVPKVGISY
jgi:hypothetical protein